MRTQIEDRKVLSMLAKAGKIQWPVLVNWPKNKKPYPLYVNDIPEIGDFFEHDGIKYELRYLYGCFMPYLFKIN